MDTFNKSTACRNPGCDEGKYHPAAEFLCQDCFLRQIGDAVKEIAMMCKKAYGLGALDFAVWLEDEARSKAN